MKTLVGARVLVTRARKQASNLVEQIEARGGEAIALPSIEITPPDNPERLQLALQESWDWIVFTSANAVEQAAALIPIQEVSQRAKLAVVGPATAKAIVDRGGLVSAQPKRAIGDDVPGALGDLHGKRVLLPRGNLARLELNVALQQAGALVTEVEAYQTVSAPWTDVPSTPPNLLTFTSSSGVTNTMERLAEHALLDWLRVPIISIGPITTETLLLFNHAPAATAETYTIDGLVEAIEQFWTARLD